MRIAYEYYVQWFNQFYVGSNSYYKGLSHQTLA